MFVDGINVLDCRIPGVGMKSRVIEIMTAQIELFHQCFCPWKTYKKSGTV